MTVGLLDLSIVTDQLLAQLRLAFAGSRLWSEEPDPLHPPTGTSLPGPGIPVGDTTPGTRFDAVFTGMPPDAARGLAGACKVSLYLFHVSPDKFYRNTFPADPRDPSRGAARARRAPQQPLALTLYYLLSAHSESYVEEQQAMSIALKAFHDQAIVIATVPDGHRAQEFTVVLEAQTIDEIGRLWQAAATSLRLSSVYRASVIFLEPEPPTVPVPGVVTDYTVSAYPQFLVSRATVTPAGRVTVWGRRFDDAALEVRLDGAVLTATPTTPPPVGTVHVIDATTLELQLASGTPKGVRRLGVTIAGEDVEAVFTLKVAADVP